MPDDKPRAPAPAPSPAAPGASAAAPPGRATGPQAAVAPEGAPAPTKKRGLSSIAKIRLIVAALYVASLGCFCGYLFWGASRSSDELVRVESVAMNEELSSSQKGEQVLQLVDEYERQENLNRIMLTLAAVLAYAGIGLGLVGDVASGVTRRRAERDRAAGQPTES